MIWGLFGEVAITIFLLYLQMKPGPRVLACWCTASPECPGRWRSRWPTSCSRERWAWTMRFRWCGHASRTSRPTSTLWSSCTHSSASLTSRPATGQSWFRAVVRPRQRPPRPRSAVVVPHFPRPVGSSVTCPQINLRRPTIGAPEPVREPTWASTAAPASRWSANATKRPSNCSGRSAVAFHPTPASSSTGGRPAVILLNEVLP